MYAVIEDSGSQIKVCEGDVIRVATRDLPSDTATITFDKILMISGKEDTKAKPQIGQPFIKDAKVTADVLTEAKGDKVTIIKFKRRKTYKRESGHRQPYLKVQITSIQA